MALSDQQYANIKAHAGTAFADKVKGQYAAADQAAAQQASTQQSAMQRRMADLESARQGVVNNTNRFQMEAAPTPTANAAPQALPEYDIQRGIAQKRIANETAQQRSQIMGQAGQNSDAITRRFAALGGLNSGAAIKAQEMADQDQKDKLAQLGQQEGQRSDEANQQINAQEAAAQREQRQAAEQRDFQANEAVKGRNFQRENANLDQDFKQKMFNYEAGSKMAELDNQDREFQLNQDIAEFNKRKARYEAGRTGGLFGSGGFLGTGLGASDAEF